MDRTYTLPLFAIRGNGSFVVINNITMVYRVLAGKVTLAFNGNAARPWQRTRLAETLWQARKYGVAIKRENHASPLPFAFEPRPFDQLFPNMRKRAHDLGICAVCDKPVDYAALSPLDQREYRISYYCPSCFEFECAMANADDEEEEA